MVDDRDFEVTQRGDQEILANSSRGANSRSGGRAKSGLKNPCPFESIN